MLGTSLKGLETLFLVLGALRDATPGTTIFAVSYGGLVVWLLYIPWFLKAE